MSMAQISMEMLAQARDNTLKVLSISKAFPDNYAIDIELTQLAYIKFKIGNNHETINYINESINYLTELNAARRLEETYWIKGRILLSMDKVDEAIEEQQKA